MKVFDVKAYPGWRRRSARHLDSTVLAPGARFDEHGYSRSLGICLGLCDEDGVCPFRGCRADAAGIETGCVKQDPVKLH